MSAWRRRLIRTIVVAMILTDITICYLVKDPPGWIGLIVASVVSAVLVSVGKFLWDDAGK